ncbi:hypothetical protein XBJ2_1630022 [Xenorhabdus bovienii str. Jollieti]|nr:hypothetical protein XBJ2_1630022 [Xenorhabdus bovienii str. Jollieti]
MVRLYSSYHFMLLKFKGVYPFYNQKDLTRGWRLCPFVPHIREKRDAFFQFAADLMLQRCIDHQTTGHHH